MQSLVQNLNLASFSSVGNPLCPYSIAYRRASEMMVFEGITSEQRHLTASTLSWALAAHALQSKSSFSIALIYTIIHRNLASASTNPGSEKGGLVPPHSGVRQLQRSPGHWWPTRRVAACARPRVPPAEGRCELNQKEGAFYHYLHVAGGLTESGSCDRVLPLPSEHGRT